ncbi:transcriptional repressor TraM [Agrobacterium tumefaciens]|uniref:transcriptional repressor TraM n=1 Tax=Agrobacterium tumefaciens TaxID=358 RepID=UPI0015746EC9|nr:transcriptional repressor TraM [Agrobacterium tumefaciens]WCK69397.1 transcriptional repressor TraM [Agrobacterium tumefaciens]
MELEDATVTKKVELRPLIGLTHGLPPADLEAITIDAIRTHRQLVEKADELFQALPETYKKGKEAGGPQHARYIEASIQMHAQMSAVSTLISILGFIPEVVVD